MKERLELFIKNNLEVDNRLFGSMYKMRANSITNYMEEEVRDYASINEFVDNNKNDNKFQKLLFKYIDDRGLKDSDVYNKVHIDRRLFSKIRNDSDYHPSRETVILLGLALELNIEEFTLLMESASYSLPRNNYYDLIIRFCFMEGIYKIRDVNDLLELYSCKLFSY